jgi:type VI secretion system protein ImpB
MSSNDSIHKKLEKVRKPRVHISYDVENNGAQIKRELPFVAGVLGDFVGHNTEGLKPLKERKFIQIDADNFDDVMQRMQPKLQFKVKNTLEDNDTELPVELNFKKMEDLEPAKIAMQIEPLAKLLELRAKLSDLLSKADRSDELEQLLEQALNNTDSLKSLSDELELKPADDKGEV